MAEPGTQIARLLSIMAQLRNPDGVRPTRWDVRGAGLCLSGMAVIMFGPRHA